MKVNALVSLYNARVKNINNLTPDIVISTITDLVKPISYIPFDSKLKLCHKAITDAEKTEYPTAERYRNLIINMIAAYTNIEMDKNGFDILSENKMLDVILSTFESEYKMCATLLKMCCDDIEGR